MRSGQRVATLQDVGGEIELCAKQMEEEICIIESSRWR